MAEEAAVDAITTEEDIDAASSPDAVQILDVGVVRAKIGVLDAEEAGDVGEVVFGGDVVGRKGEIAASSASGFRSSEE